MIGTTTPLQSEQKHAGCPPDRFYLISESEISMWQIIDPMSPMCQELRQAVRSRPATSAEKVLDECGTCYLKGTRACNYYHGYPNIPPSCEYKVGIYAQFALDNLAGTFIIKNLRLAEKGEREQR